MSNRKMKPILSPSVEFSKPDGPAAKTANAIIANVVTGFNSSLIPVLRGVAREIQVAAIEKGIFDDEQRQHLTRGDQGRADQHMELEGK